MTETAKFPSAPDLNIPARIVIGLIGGQEIQDENPDLVEQGRQIGRKIRDLFPAQPNTPVLITLLCRGSQRLGSVAQEILKITEAQLELIPEPLKHQKALPPDQVIAAFLHLHPRLRDISHLDLSSNTEETIGHYIVNHSDVLVVTAPAGFTDAEHTDDTSIISSVIDYARRRKRPLFIVSSKGATNLQFELGRSAAPSGGGSDASETWWLKTAKWMEKNVFKKETELKRFEYLDQYNAESAISEEKIRSEADIFLNGSRGILQEARKAGLPTDQLEENWRVLALHFAKADELALHYQRRYLRAGMLIYAMAASAVAVVAFQALFLVQWPQLVIIEALLMFTILWTIWLSQKHTWHQKWLDYRYLAERLRAAVFLVAAKFEVGRRNPPRHLSLAYSPSDWMVAAFSSICCRMSYVESLPAEALPALKVFLANAWLADQIRFHEKASKTHYIRHYRSEYLGISLFLLTFIAAGLHALHLGPHWAGNVLAFVCIVFPAIGSSLAAVRIQREYHRNSRRYAEMARHLRELKELISGIRAFENLPPILREIEQTMLDENLDWKVLIQSRDLEPA